MYISMKFSFWGESGKENTEDKPIKLYFKWDYSPLHQGKIKLNTSIFQCLGLFKKVNNKLKLPLAAIYDILILKLKGIVYTAECIKKMWKIFKMCSKNWITR